jgi:L-ribulokinase
MNNYVIGLDFGTDSVRALLVDAQSGEELNSSVSLYPRWKKGSYCNPSTSQFRQHPLDYLESMETAITSLVDKTSPEIVANIKGLSIDTTGSTPVAVDKSGTPLALLPEFAENPNAMFILWKDHTAIEEANEINQLSYKWSTDYTKYSGGIYSSEWFWSKILHTIRVDESIYEAAYSWVEHCDWLPGLLTGNTNPLELKRSRCTAGHKALWHEEFGGLPSEDFLKTLDPKLAGLRDRLFTETYTADVPAGTISAEWAERLKLPQGVIIGTGAIDAHFGAVGACIEPYSLVKVVGTSTCDMVIAPTENYTSQTIKGICGQVDGSIIPNMLGMEAGQSAFGDFYAWFQQLLSFPINELIGDLLTDAQKEAITAKILPKLSEEAASLPVTEQDVIALDWINGRRTPDADQTLKSAITGINLGTSAAQLFKAFVEATAFGSKAIIERFKQEGVPVKDVIALGGITKKSAYVMQTLSNVFNLPIQVVTSEQTCALGAAMYAATASGIYPNIEEAQKAMSSGFDATYEPEQDKVAVYEKLYANYIKLGAFVAAKV